MTTISSDIQGVTEEKIKAGPKREHVATAAEREHWSNTNFLKQTTAGAVTVATARHPICRKQKNGIENMFADKETILPQDWNKRHSGNNSTTQKMSSFSVLRTDNPSTYAKEIALFMHCAFEMARTHSFFTQHFVRFEFGDSFVDTSVSRSSQIRIQTSILG